MPDPIPSATRPRAAAAATTAVRLGYHGSPEVARRIVRLAGHDERAVRLRTYDITDPFRALRSGRLDLMIVKFGPREPDLATSRTLAYDARAVVVAARHPLATRPSVSVEDVAGYDVFDCPGSLPGHVWDEVVPRRTPAGRPLRRRHRFTDVPRVMRLVAEGAAVHLSLVSLADTVPATVRVVPVHDLPPAPVSLAWRRSPEPAPHIRDFVRAAEEATTR
ncbi:LysR family transcriptional regulator [Streptomyces sp. PRKS01-65]|nr:LysR substrate-binding domain-containing protein [Streptomyces harenosi]NEY36816.1 LysR family transcriptional regulator [Streptomyces harenosi]